MKVLGICTSPRPGKTSLFGLQKCFEALKEKYPQIRTEIVELAGRDIRPCIACDRCKTALTCSQQDGFFEIIPLLADPELKALVFATPVYMGCMTAQCKAFLDRSVMFRRNGFLFRNKIGAVIAVGNSRNGGQELTIQAVQASLLIHDMLVVSDGISSAHFGATLCAGVENGIAGDVYGIKTAANLGRRIGELISLIHV